MRACRLAGSPLSQTIPRSVPEIPNRCSVLLGPLGPVTQSTSDVGAPAMEAGGGADCGAGCGAGCDGFGAALGRNCVAFGVCGKPGAGGFGPGGGTTPAWGCS